MLTAVNIGLRIGGRKILQHVDIEVRPGEVVALLGENGAGKSTLLKILAGDIRPHSGVVRMNGRPLFLWPMRDRARARAVLQQDQTVPVGYSAAETVLFGRYPHADAYPGPGDEEIAREALRLTGAGHLAARNISTLSGGERARVLLAKTFAQIWTSWQGEARYLLLDEPTASLDPAQQHHILQAVRRFAQAESIGVCAVLHDLNLAAQYADRMLLLKDGIRLACGEPGDVLTQAHLQTCFGVQAVILPHPRHPGPLVVTSA
jgi:iron complex transport system ATP-binding protein